MSGKIRIRRAPSPLHGAQSTQRYPPHSYDNLGADERRDLARLDPKNIPRRSQHPSGTVRIADGELKLLVVICVIAVLVRLFRLSKPDSVV